MPYDDKHDRIKIAHSHDEYGCGYKIFMDNYVFSDLVSGLEYAVEHCKNSRDIRDDYTLEHVKRLYEQLEEIRSRDLGDLA
jgi:hypothetical protein